MTFRYFPPPALASLNSRDQLIAQAEELERFAATEQSLGEDGGAGRLRFWRASAALRVAANVIVDDPGALAEYCVFIDSERARMRP